MTGRFHQWSSHSFLGGCLLSCLGVVFAAQTTPEIFERAVHSLSSGDYAAAETGFRQVLSKEPDNMGALGNLGVVYSKIGQYAEAVETYRRALKFAPDEPGLLLNLALAFLKQENYRDALPVLQHLLLKRPGDEQARELEATCQIYTGSAAVAVRSLESLPRTSGVLYLLGVGYLKLGRRDDAAREFENLIAGSPPAQASFLLGKAYYESGLFGEAAAQLERSLKLDDRLPELHLELGKTYVSLRRNDEAEKELRLAIANDPRSSEANYFLGGLLVILHREDDALPFLSAAEKLNPDFWGSHYYFGRALLEKNRYAEAISELERALKANPSGAAILYQLARAYRAAGRDREAAEAAERVKSLLASGRENEIQVLRNK